MTPPARRAVEPVVERLRREPALLNGLTAWRRVPARPAVCAPWPAGVDPRLLAALAGRGIREPYGHQAQAIAAALEGRHVVVVTGTASGKTLCYNVPVLTALLADPQARALYLFPTKALTQDQAAALDALLEAAEAELPVHTYDGDTEAEARPRVRSRARVLLTNPDMLHTGILPHHTKWAAFFRGLRYVVLDELHTYRGVFGSHMANVLRRLQRVCRFYGAAPCFICCSATVANPAQLAEGLIGQPVTVVDDDGAPHGERHILFYNPPIVDHELGIRRSPLLEGRGLAARLIGAGLQTIVFTRARVATEVLLTYLQSDAERNGWGPRTVRGYRGGYLAEERRAVERGLRQGAVRGVVATNALELGVDIGELAAVVMVGYPGTVASTWQQMGRAGRRRGSSLAVLVAGGSPLDQYIVGHPEYFFGRSPEHALLDADNPLILLGHLACAAFELPFAEGETYGGRDVAAHLALLEQEGLLHRAAGVTYWLGQQYPAESVSLRAAGMDVFVIAEEGSGRTVGKVERYAAPSLIHEGAIYLHEGQSYQVSRLDWEGRRATVAPVQVDYYTEASTSSSVEVMEERAQARAGPPEAGRGGAGIGWGAVRVTSVTSAYRKVRLFTHENLGWGMIDLPEQQMETVGTWLWFPPETAAPLVAEGVLSPEVRFDRGPNWAEMRRRARERDGCRCRHCGAPERPDREHDVHHVRPFREFGYVPGVNDHYLAANQLGNLVTLCRGCHWRADGAQMPGGALAGLAHALGNVAPLFLMCDPRDIGVVAEVRSSHTGGPTVTVYDRVAGGIGLSQQLYAIQRQVLEAAGTLVAACTCQAGCPACIGPALEQGKNTKEHVLRLVQAALE
ncbi:MAG TPA: DEAD/DEAH box helicase [Anaerolineae bacterium]|nr:DEAD/DEAH box helicase [Anaerolineae bacterium]HOQ97279.1 DEAD/DEAH box helicase [Anaerolineae bacterium]HPL27589.1 DEAD/DEAH box helicase [Anaerolineae bacterium]